MGSLGAGVNLLEYLKSKSDVDCDCLDTQRELIPEPARFAIQALTSGHKLLPS